MCVASQPAEITITRRIVDEITPKSARRTESEAAWHFRDVTIDLDRQTLLRNGEEVRLRAKSFDVLAHLIRHAGKLVTKQEMLDAVWGEVAVTDDSLVQCLVEIRRALGETQDVIKTVRSRGYLLDAVVHPGAMVAVETRSTVAATTAGASNRWRLGVAGVLAVALVLGWAAWDRISRGPEGTVAIARSVSREETLNPDARRAFEEGASLMMGRRSQVELQQARQAFERAVVLDPQFAPAHSALSNVLTILFAFGVERPRQVLPEASRHARRAVELDPTHAFGWHALAHSQVQWEWDWAAAETSFRRAQALDPKNPYPRFLLAHLLVGIGRADEGLREVESALATDPRSPQLLGSKGIVNYLARRPEVAVDAFARARAIDPNYSLAAFWQSLAYSSLGRDDEAMEAALAARRQMANAPTWVVGYVHAKAGRTQEARDVLNALEARARQQYVPAVDLAFLQVALGDDEAAIGRLEQGLRQHSRWMELLAVHPVVDPLRGNPRFQRILRAMRLPEIP